MRNLSIELVSLVMTIVSSLRVKFWFSLGLSLLFLIVAAVLLLWANYYAVPVGLYGVLPRTLKGALGILSAPLFHSNYDHYISNFLPFLLLNTIAGYIYPRAMPRLFLVLYFGSGLFVWLFARGVVHLGASGIIYGLAAFLFFSGLFRWDRRSIAIAIAVVFFYGYLVWGVFPGDPDISWETHLGGTVIGALCAYYLRKYDVYAPADESSPEEDEDILLNGDYSDDEEQRKL